MESCQCLQCPTTELYNPGIKKMFYSTTAQHKHMLLVYWLAQIHGKLLRTWLWPQMAKFFDSKDGIHHCMTTQKWTKMASTNVWQLKSVQTQMCPNMASTILFELRSVQRWCSLLVHCLNVLYLKLIYKEKHKLFNQ